MGVVGMTAGWGDLAMAVVTAGARSQGHIWMGWRWEHLDLRLGNSWMGGSCNGESRRARRRVSWVLEAPRRAPSLRRFSSFWMKLIKLTLISASLSGAGSQQQGGRNKVIKAERKIH